ncbi:hypothetical protein [Bosea sp. (in: a-proteobacteria)]|uniref:hypothetical protein n=1 Tax=Bosea sp. (in: a-proteobacteria) TaxID=1871050 RepID=UPI002FC922B4
MTAACLTVASPAVTSAQTQMFAGFDEQDPIGSAAKELWRQVNAQCGPLKTPVLVGTASLPVTAQAFTKDQGNNLMGQVHAAFSRLDGLKMAPLGDIGALLEVKGAGLTATPNAGDVEAILDKVEIVIRATGQRVGPNTNFVLQAIGRRDYQCSPSVGPVSVPANLVGEIYKRAENIFADAAREVWRRTRGSVPLVLSASLPNGTSLDPQLPDYFQRLMEKAIDDARRTAPEESVGNPTQVPVISPMEASAEATELWAASVIVVPRPNGYHLSINVRRKDETAVFSDGLVSTDDLPAMQWAALGPSSSVRAVVPRLGAAPLRLNGRVAGGRGFQEYAFSVGRESYVEVDIPTTSVPGVQKALKLDVFGARNIPLKTIHIVNPSRPNLRRYRLPAGQYTIRVASGAQTEQSYQLRARAVDTTDMLLPEAPGRLIRQFQNWYASVVEDPRTGRRTCYAYTAAVEAGPLNWREQAPFILLSAQSEGSGEIQHLIEDKRFYRPGAPFEAMIDDGGAMRELNASATATGNFIRPTKQGSNGQPILDMDAVAGYNRGTKLEINGITPDGRPAHVVYSLRGYQAAVNAMSLECGRRDLANALVWK